MIPTRTCLFSGCDHHPLESLEEIAIGLCHRHKIQYQDSDYLTLSCWSCGIPLETVHKTKMVEGVVIEEDYIFTKTCPECDDVRKDTLQYVTTNAIVPELPTLVTDSGHLIDSDGVIIGA